MCVFGRYKCLTEPNLKNRIYVPALGSANLSIEIYIKYVLLQSLINNRCNLTLSKYLDSYSGDNDLLSGTMLKNG